MKMAIAMTFARVYVLACSKLGSSSNPHLPYVHVHFIEHNLKLIHQCNIYSPEKAEIYQYKLLCYCEM